MSDSRPILDRQRADSPPPFRAVGTSKVETNWAAIIAGGAVLFMAGLIYAKMPSADQIAALDAKHTTAVAELQIQVDQHAAAISKVSGQVGLLVRIEVAKANADDDPEIKQAIRVAARDARAEATKPVQSGDPLAGIDLED
jgi:hypothetical protein